MYQKENIYINNQQPMDGTAAETVAHLLPFFSLYAKLVKITE